MYALKANLFVLDRSAGLFHGGLVGANCVSGIPRNSWAVYPGLPKWSIVIGTRAQFLSVIVAIVSVGLVHYARVYVFCLECNEYYELKG